MRSRTGFQEREGGAAHGKTGRACVRHRSQGSLELPHLAYSCRGQKVLTGEFGSAHQALWRVGMSAKLKIWEINGNLGTKR